MNILQSFPVVLNMFKVSFFLSVVYFFIRRPSATDLGLFILTEVFMVYLILFGLLTDHNRNIILHSSREQMKIVKAAVVLKFHFMQIWKLKVHL